MTTVHHNPVTIPEFDLADRIRKALREADLNGKQAAHALGVTQSAISYWINGTSQPTRRYLASLSALTGVSLEWLIEGVDPADTRVAQLEDDRNTWRHTAHRAMDHNEDLADELLHLKNHYRTLRERIETILDEATTQAVTLIEENP